MALMNIATKFSGLLSRGAAALLPRYSSRSVNASSSRDEELQAKNIIETVRNLIDENSSRAFAIVHLMGKQRKVTAGDLIMMEGYWPPNVGDEINLEKVLLAGTSEFTLIGRPLVQPGLVKVKATVVSKALSVTKTRLRKKPKKQFMRINFCRPQQTVLRINDVTIGSNLNDPPYVLKTL